MAKNESARAMRGEINSYRGGSTNINSRHGNFESKDSSRNGNSGNKDVLQDTCLKSAMSSTDGMDSVGIGVCLTGDNSSGNKGGSNNGGGEGGCEIF